MERQPGLPQDAVRLQHVVQGTVIEQKRHIAHGKGGQRDGQRRGAHLLRDAAAGDEQQHQPVRKTWPAI